MKPKRFQQAGGISQRTVAAVIEVRASDGEASGAIPVRGMPILYNTWTEIYDPWLGPYQECIAPGAAARAILEDDVRLLINHDSNLVLARSTNSTLRATEGMDGVAMEADMAPTSYARDLAISMQRGDVSQMSFSFSVEEEDWDVRPDGIWMRTVQAIRLYDYSIVTFPAYADTEASLRMRQLRAGRRNSSADEDLIRSAVDSIRGAADDLEGILGTTEEADAENKTATRSVKELQEARHRNLLALMGTGG